MTDIGDPKKIRARIRRYERALEKERQWRGHYHDGAGKRYLLGPLYLLMGDLEGALEAFHWFEREFPQDGGEPGHWLCWALATLRSGDAVRAVSMLRRAMLSNIYMLPRLLGEKISPLEIWHSTSFDELAHIDEIPPAFLALWTAEEQAWARATYEGDECTAVRNRWIEIHREILREPPGPRRSALARESSRLKRE